MRRNVPTCCPLSVFRSGSPLLLSHKRVHPTSRSCGRSTGSSPHLGRLERDPKCEMMFPLARELGTTAESRKRRPAAGARRSCVYSCAFSIKALLLLLIGSVQLHGFVVSPAHLTAPARWLGGSSSSTRRSPRGCMMSGGGGAITTGGRREITWSNPTGDDMVQVLGDVWCAERPFVWNGIDVGGCSRYQSLHHHPRIFENTSSSFNQVDCCCVLKLPRLLCHACCVHSTGAYDPRAEAAIPRGSTCGAKKQPTSAVAMAVTRATTQPKTLVVIAQFIHGGAPQLTVPPMDRPPAIYTTPKLDRRMALL